VRAKTMCAWAFGIVGSQLAEVGLELQKYSATASCRTTGAWAVLTARFVGRLTMYSRARWLRAKKGREVRCQTDVVKRTRAAGQMAFSNVSPPRRQSVVRAPRGACVLERERRRTVFRSWSAEASAVVAGKGAIETAGGVPWKILQMGGSEAGSAVGLQIALACLCLMRFPSVGGQGVGFLPSAFCPRVGCSVVGLWRRVAVSRRVGNSVT
jgi:hypothetical protein